MQKFKLDKTISANSNGIVILYQNVKKHQYISYDFVKKIQEQGTIRYQTIEEPIQFSSKQKKLFNQVVNGFKAYTREDTVKMSTRMKTNIMVAYTKAQRLLNKWKQEIIYNEVDSFLLTLFPNSLLVKKMNETIGTLNKINKKDDISFKDLGITNKAIANKLIKHNLLPQNFFQLI